MDNQLINEDSEEVYKAISDNREGMVTHMINTEGFQKAAIRLHISPLSVTDIYKPAIDDDNDDDDDDDDTAAKEQSHHIRRHRKHPRAPAYVASSEGKQYNTITGTKPNDEPEEERSQTLNELPEIENSEIMTTRPDHESLFANDEDENKKFEGITHSSNLVSKHPKVKRKSMRKHPIPDAIV